MQLQKHHCIPLSLFGIDHGANTIYIPKWQHEMIHGKMNIPMRTYSQMYRTFRKRHNHKPMWDTEYVRDILAMQLAYLNNWVKLPMASQHLYVQKMRELCVHYAKETNDGISFPKNIALGKEWQFLLSEYQRIFKLQVR